MSDGFSITKEEMITAFANGLREHLYTQEHMGIGSVNSAIKSAVRESMSEFITEDMVKEGVKSACKEFLQDNRENCQLQW